MAEVIGEIRRAAADDAAAVRDLARAAYAKWIAVVGREPVPMRFDYGEAIQKHRIDVLFVDSRLTAFVQMSMSPEQFLIVNIAVDPAMQGQGHGGRLLQHAETLAASLGYGRVELYTNEKFVSNTTWYLNTGYKIDREAPFMGGVIIYMSKAVE